MSLIQIPRQRTANPAISVTFGQLIEFTNKLVIQHNLPSYYLEELRNLKLSHFPEMSETETLTFERVIALHGSAGTGKSILIQIATLYFSNTLPYRIAIISPTVTTALNTAQKLWPYLLNGKQDLAVIVGRSNRNRYREAFLETQESFELEHIGHDVLDYSCALAGLSEHVDRENPPCLDLKYRSERGDPNCHCPFIDQCSRLRQMQNLEQASVLITTPEGALLSNIQLTDQPMSVLEYVTKTFNICFIDEADSAQQRIQNQLSPDKDLREWIEEVGSYQEVIRRKRSQNLKRLQVAGLNNDLNQVGTIFDWLIGYLSRRPDACTSLEKMSFFNSTFLQLNWIKKTHEFIREIRSGWSDEDYQTIKEELFPLLKKGVKSTSSDPFSIATTQMFYEEEFDGDPDNPVATRLTQALSQYASFQRLGQTEKRLFIDYFLIILAVNALLVLLHDADRQLTASEMAIAIKTDTPQPALSSGPKYLENIFPRLIMGRAAGLVLDRGINHDDLNLLYFSLLFSGPDLIANLSQLYELDDYAGCHFVLATATGWLPDGRSIYHLRTDGYLLQRQGLQHGKINLHYHQFSKSNGNPIFVSGRESEDKLVAISEITKRLFEGGSSSIIEQDLQQYPEARRRALLTTNSKAQCWAVWEALEFMGQSDRCKVLVGDNDNLDGFDPRKRAACLRRRHAESFATIPGVDVLIAYSQGVSRDINIVPPGSREAAFCVLYSLVRPHAHPTNLQISIELFLVSLFETDKRLPELLARRAKLLAEKEPPQPFGLLEQCRYYARIADRLIDQAFKRQIRYLPKSPKSFMNNILLNRWWAEDIGQLWPRITRGQVDATVRLCDAAYSAYLKDAIARAKQLQKDPKAVILWSQGIQALLNIKGF